jgi:hypothetical protein
MFLPIGRGRASLPAQFSGLWRALMLALSTLCLVALPSYADAEDANYLRVIRTRYEAVNAKAGGNFIIWLEREKVWHGLDPRLYPAVKYVDVTHLTPSPGSGPITVIEILSINSTIPEFYHIAGIVRFKVTGMILKSSNIPAP